MATDTLKTTLRFARSTVSAYRNTLGEMLDVDVMRWLILPDWPASRDYLDRRAELTYDDADTVLTDLMDIAAGRDEAGVGALTKHRELLRRCAAAGLDTAFGEVGRAKPTLGHRSILLLGLNAQMRYQRTGEARYWRTATTSWLTVLSMLAGGLADRPPSAPVCIHVCVLVCHSFRERFTMAHEIGALRAAIEILDRVLEVVAPETVGWADAATCLAESRHLRSRTPAAEPDDIDQAITLYQQLLMSEPPGSPGVAKRFNDLGQALWERSYRTGNPADLDLAVKLFDRAAVQAARYAPERAKFLTDAGLARLGLISLTHDHTNFDRVIGDLREAVARTPAGDSERPRRVLQLAKALYARNEMLAPGDLDPAILVLKELVTYETPAQGDLAWGWARLAECLRDRFRRGRDRATLAEAITACEVALRYTAEETPERAEQLGVLGELLHLRYECHGDPSTLDRAVEVGEQALAMTASDAPDRARRLTSLGMALHSRYGHGGDQEDLRRALAACAQAAESVTAGSPDRTAVLNNLAIVAATADGSGESLERQPPI